MHFFNGLRHRMILLSIGVLSLYYILVCLFSVLFMEPYYLHKVETSLVSAYQQLSRMGDINLETISSLESHNISMVIADSETLEIVYNSQFSDRFMDDMRSRVLPSVRDRASVSDTGYYIITDEMYQHTTSGVTVSSGKRIMLGGLTQDYLLDLSTSYESIAQATSISIQFSLIVGLLIMVLAILAYSRMSSSVLEPVTQITRISKKIADLDFSEKCSTNMPGEIGEMAESVNTMSDFMQAHIAQLEAANQQLHADIDMIHAQEEARKNLVSNLSHDLKTPIGLISGYADGLRHGMAKTDDEVREYCDVICDESDRMMSMILKMMELFRLESGTVELEMEEFDLYDLINYLVEVFGIEFEREQIDFSADYHDCLYITADYFAVEQVLTNYLQNAIAHMKDGKTLRLTVSELEDTYRVTIYNSTPPIPQEEMDRIWDSFYRLDKSRTRSRQQSGLGLSIVRGNMELLHGKYGVNNAQGGVEFWAEFQKSPEKNTEI